METPLAGTHTPKLEEIWNKSAERADGRRQVTLSEPFPGPHLGHSGHHTIAFHSSSGPEEKAVCSALLPALPLLLPMGAYTGSGAWAKRPPAFWCQNAQVPVTLKAQLETTQTHTEKEHSASSHRMDHYITVKMTQLAGTSPSRCVLADSGSTPETTHKGGREGEQYTRMTLFL